MHNSQSGAERLRNARQVARRAVRVARNPRRLRRVNRILDELRPEVRADLERCQPYTMLSVERQLANMDAIEYAVRRQIPGAIVECGVWKGGSVLGMILTLQRLGVNDREIWLFDTFEGMTEPTEHDLSAGGDDASGRWAEAVESGNRLWEGWFAAEVFNLDLVRATLVASGYPEHLIHFVKGPVEETIPAQMPDQIAVLRLDTDWYESTRHELVHLYPAVSEGGVLIIDDYGAWQGAKKAVDEYFESTGEVLLLHRTDDTGRVAIKA